MKQSFVIDVGDHKADFVNMAAKQNPKARVGVDHGNGVAAGVGELGVGEFLAIGQGLGLNGFLIPADRRGSQQVLQKFTIHGDTSFPKINV